MKEAVVIIPLQLEMLRLSDLPKVFHFPWPVQKGEFSEYSSVIFCWWSWKFPWPRPQVHISKAFYNLDEHKFE